MKAGADVNTPSVIGHTPFWAAVNAGAYGASGHIGINKVADMVTLLSDKDVDIEVNIELQSHDGASWTPLKSAIIRGLTDVVHILLKRVADPGMPTTGEKVI